jgi:hypothetical protein
MSDENLSGGAIDVTDWADGLSQDQVEEAFRAAAIVLDLELPLDQYDVLSTAFMDEFSLQIRTIIAGQMRAHINLKIGDS